MNVVIDPVIRQAAPELRESVIIAGIESNGPTSDALWQRILDACAVICGRYPMDQIRHRPAIAGTRDAYKALGKEPNRYRPSAEALCRRAVKGLGLYRMLTVIDLINLVSLLTGHSIGGFDADKVSGDTITLGVGAPGEPYEAIGRGLLNIECLPVWRDNVGGIGTPTSDNERTKLSEDTTRLLLTVNLYRENPDYPQVAVEEMFRDLLAEFAGLESFNVIRL